MSRHLLSNLFISASLVLGAASCTQNTVNLEFGKIVLHEDGFDLPMASKPGRKAKDYTLGVAFGEEKVFMFSKKDLYESRISFFFEDEGQIRIKDCDFDFVGKQGELYVFSLPYSLFVPKGVVDKVKQVLVTYVPKYIELKQLEEKHDGFIETYPDCTGYFFVFNQDEYRQYFKDFNDHLL